MKCWLMWHGGSSYSLPSAEDAEEFDSLKDLAHSFDGRQYDSYYPMVSDEQVDDGGPGGWIFFADPRLIEANLGGDLYPDRIIDYGPRGGVRITEA